MMPVPAVRGLPGCRKAKGGQAARPRRPARRGSSCVSAAVGLRCLGRGQAVHCPGQQPSAIGSMRILQPAGPGVSGDERIAVVAPIAFPGACPKAGGALFRDRPAALFLDSHLAYRPRNGPGRSLPEPPAPCKVPGELRPPASRSFMLLPKARMLLPKARMFLPQGIPFPCPDLRHVPHRRQGTARRWGADRRFGHPGYRPFPMMRGRPVPAYPGSDAGREHRLGALACVHDCLL